MQNITVVKLLGDNLSDAMDMYKYDAIAEHLTNITPEYSGLYSPEGIFNISSGTQNETLPVIPECTAQDHMWYIILLLAFVVGMFVGIFLYRCVYMPNNQKPWYKRLQDHPCWRRQNPRDGANGQDQDRSMNALVANTDKGEAEDGEPANV